MNFQIPVKQLC